MKIGVLARLLCVGIGICACKAVFAEDVSRTTISKEVDQLVMTYYYSNPDTIHQLLEPLYAQASSNQLWDQCFLITLHLTSVAQEMDSLDQWKRYSKKGDLLLDQHQEYISKYDSNAYMRAYHMFFKGRFHYEMLDYSDAIKAFGAILKIEDADLDSLLTFNTHLNIAQSAYNLGDYEQARRHCLLARVILPKQDDTYAAGRGYLYKSAFIESLLAKVIFYKGKSRSDMTVMREALGIYRRADALLNPIREKKYSYNLANTIQKKMAECYLEMGRYDSANWHVRQALDMPEHSHVVTMEGLMLAAKIQLKHGYVDLADPLIEQAFTICRQHFPTDHPYAGRVYYQKAWSKMLHFAYPQALQYADSAMQCFVYPSEGGSHAYLINEMDVLRLRTLIGDVYRLRALSEADLHEALIQYRKIIELSEKMRQTFHSAESQQYLMADIYPVFEKAIEVLYRFEQIGVKGEQWNNEVIYFFEKNRNMQLYASRAVNEVLSERIPLRITSRAQDLKMDIAVCKRHFMQSDTSRNKLHKLELAYQNYEKFIDSVQTIYPRYMAWTNSSEAPEWSILNEDVMPDETVISFFWGNNNVYGIQLRQDEINLYQLGATKIFEQQLNKYLSGIRHAPNEADSTQSVVLAGAELFSLMQSLFNTPLENPEFIIIPDGPLGYLPFEALVTDSDSGEVVWLLEKSTIHYLPGLSFLQATELHKPAELSYLGIAPAYGSEQMVADNRNLGALLFNSTEIAHSNDYFNGITLFGEQATESNFYKLSSNCDILHLSLHAEVNEAHPDNSALYFTLPDSSILFNEEGESDGVVRLYEMYRHEMNCQLAVLSACETGYGIWAKGEGVLSLGRAFQYAGCPSVAMSLWKVNDKTTAEIITLFMKNIESGMPKDKALRAAKLSFLRDHKNKYFQHPYYWSTFILQGQTVPIHSKAASTLWIWLAIGSSLLFTIVWIRRKRLF